MFKLLAKTFQSKSDLKGLMFKDDLKIKRSCGDLALFSNYILTKIAQKSDVYWRDTVCPITGTIN